MTARLRPSGGSSLVEAVLALGLLAGLLLSIAGLFSMGARRVRGAGAGSEALARARAIVEEIDAWSYRRVWAEFGRSGAVSRFTVDTRTEPRAAAWQQSLVDALGAAWAEVAVRSLGPGTTTPPLEDSVALRVQVTVRWNERGRPREVALCMVRM